MLGKQALSIVLVLLLAPVLAGCTSEDDSLMPQITPPKGFFWDYGELKLWHAGNGSVLDARGEEVNAEFIGLQVPGWMKLLKWEDSWNETEAFNDPERPLQVQLAVTPDLREVIAYRRSCTAMLSERPEGPWFCSEEERHRMFWYPFGSPWFFGVSDFIEHWDDSTSDPERDGKWNLVEESKHLRLEGLSKDLTASDWLDLPVDFLLPFDRGTLYFEDLTAPPKKIEVNREKGDTYTFELAATYEIPPEDLIEGGPNRIPAPDIPDQHDREDYLPFDASEEPAYLSFPWSEAWQQAERYVERPDRAVVLNARFDRSTTFYATTPAGQVDMYHQVEMTIVVLEGGGSPYEVHITRTERYPQVQQMSPASEDVLTEYEVEKVTDIEADESLSVFGISQNRVSMDGAAELAKWMLEGPIDRYEVITEIENGTATKITYSFSGWGTSFSIVADNGQFLEVHSDPDAIGRFWSPSESIIPYEFSAPEP